MKYKISILALLLFMQFGFPALAEDIDALSRAEPLTKTVLAVVKDGRPLILADILPEYPKLEKLSEAEQEEYLLRRAFALVREKQDAKKTFVDHDSFTVRFILLKDKDEYGKPLWGTAPEVALLEIERKKIVATPDVAIDAQELRNCFSSVSITLPSFQP